VAISFLFVGKLSDAMLKYSEIFALKSFSGFAMLTDMQPGGRIAMNSKRPDCAQFHIR
jgi:hypothetical protein